MKAVALYGRVSSEQQAQQANVGSQVEALRSRAKEDGHSILDHNVYVDDGFSGATLIRPALERLRDQVASGNLDAIYVHSPDRLARKYAYQVLLLEEFKQQGVTVTFLNGPMGQTAEDELLVQVQGMIAEYERAKILERSRRGKIHRARQGSVNPLSGAPYGYTYVKKADGAPARYTIALHEAKVVRWIFEALVREQKSIGEIVRVLNREKTPTRRGAPRWDRTTVWAMLQNPAYVGKAAFGKTEVIERQTPLRQVRGKGPAPRRPKSAHRDRPPEEWIHIDVPAIVSSSLFEGAKEQLARNKRLSLRNGRGDRYLLQGLTVCASCGYAFYGKPVSRAAAKGKKKRYAYYRCVGTDAYRFAGGRICQNPQVRVDQLDGHVWESVCDLLQHPQRVLDEWTRRQASDGAAEKLSARRDEASQFLDAQNRTMKRLVDAYEAGAIELSELKQRGELVRARIRQGQLDVAAAERSVQQAVSMRMIVARLGDFADRVGQGLKDLSWADRRQIIRTLVGRVEITAEGADIVYRLPKVDNDPPVSRRGKQGFSSTVQGLWLPDNNDSVPRCRGGR